MHYHYHTSLQFASPCQNISALYRTFTKQHHSTRYYTNTELNSQNIHHLTNTSPNYATPLQYSYYNLAYYKTSTIPYSTARHITIIIALRYVTLPYHTNTLPYLAIQCQHPTLPYLTTPILHCTLPCQNCTSLCQYCTLLCQYCTLLCQNCTRRNPTSPYQYVTMHSGLHQRLT